MNDIYDVIKKPRVSEKATVLHEENGVLTLEVAVKATKIEIKQAVEKAFGKKVASVRTANYDGKVRRKSVFGNQLLHVSTGAWPRP